jgi:RNA polymerase sigma factor (sigma-70 family)
MPSRAKPFEPLDSPQSLRCEAMPIMLTLTPQIETTLLEQAQARFQLLAQIPAHELALQHQKILRQGDRAVTKLLDQYQRLLYKLIHQYCPNWDVDEAFSIALQGLNKAIQSFNFSTPFLSWLRIKVTGALLDEKRRIAIKAKRQDNLHQVIRFELGAEDSEIHEIDLETFLPQVNLAVEKLSDIERLCLTLHSEGHQWPAVGAAIDKTPDASRMCFRRAIEKIRIALGLSQPKVAKRPKTIIRKAIGWMQSMAQRWKKQTVVRPRVQTSDIKAVHQPHTEQVNDFSELVQTAKTDRSLGKGTKAHPLGFLRSLWGNGGHPCFNRWAFYLTNLFPRGLRPSDPQPVPPQDPEAGTCCGIGGDRHGVCVGEYDELRASPCLVLQ